MNATLNEALDRAREGQTVAFMGRNQVDALDLFREARALAPDAHRVISSVGGERVEFIGGGRVIFTSHRSSGRGYSLDAAYVPATVVVEQGDRFLADLMPCFNTSTVPGDPIVAYN
ncbi:MAG: hypothetical protein JWP85_2121 [Rhodoglobus sp.]|nr:hypothetical protein [Rhodoglobus sp.]